MTLTLEQLVGYKHYQGLLAVCRVPCSVSLEAVLQYSPHPRFFIATDGINNADNLGVIIRNATALKVQALINGETSCPPYLRRSVRNSMGNIFKLPFVQCTSLVETLQHLRSQGVRCIAAHPRPDSLPLYKADLTNDICIVFGSEGTGISQPVLDACDECVAIPMSANVDSINVASASAVFFFEAVRQRNRQ